MALLDLRQRSGGYLFIIVAMGHLLLISAQVNSRAGVPVLEAVTFGVFAEVQRTASSLVGAVRRLWTGYVALRGLKVENDSLKHQVGDLQVQLQQQRARAQMAGQLQELLELRDRSQLSTAAAEVIASGASPDFRTLTIDKGSVDGLRRDMAVIAPAGVVGRVVMPSARAAKVQLLIDRNAAAGAIIERSRAQGVVIGVGEDRLRLEYVAETADIKNGDVVVSSGIDGIFPKGFVIGHVESIERGSGFYKSIKVKPAVNFADLEAVLVVLSPAARAPGAEGTQ
jgi:rod shape-determining protein MreC